MKTRLELKAADRRSRIKDKIRKDTVRIAASEIDREPAPRMRIGGISVKTINRQGLNERGNPSRSAPVRGDNRRR